MTPAEMLEQRICARLGELARKMAQSPIWGSYDLDGLTADSFGVLYNIDKLGNAATARTVMTLIEQTVNDNTNQMVKDTQGEFSYGNGHLGMYDGSAHLITFDADANLTAQQRYAALMVVQHFESLMRSAIKKDGRLHPAGTIIGSSYGITQSPSFDAFAYTVNGALGKHALPEKKWGQVVFMTLAKGRNPAP